MFIRTPDSEIVEHRAQDVRDEQLAKKGFKHTLYALSGLGELLNIAKRAYDKANDPDDDYIQIRFVISADGECRFTQEGPANDKIPPHSLSNLSGRACCAGNLFISPDLSQIVGFSNKSSGYQLAQESLVYLLPFLALMLPGSITLADKLSVEVFARTSLSSTVEYTKEALLIDFSAAFSKTEIAKFTKVNRQATNQQNTHAGSVKHSRADDTSYGVRPSQRQRLSLFAVPPSSTENVVSTPPPVDLSGYETP